MRIAERLRPTIHTVAIQYAPPSRQSGALGIAAAPFVAGNYWLHLFRLLGSARTEVSVIRPPRGHDPQPADFHAAAPQSASSSTATLKADVRGASNPVTAQTLSGKTGDADSTWALTTQQLMAALIKGARAVPLGAEAHAQFTEFHAKWSKGLSSARNSS